MKPIVLSDEQRKEIERRRKETLDRRVYQRLTAVLAVASGKSREEVAELLGVSLSQLGEWLRVFRNGARRPLHPPLQRRPRQAHAPPGPATRGRGRGGLLPYPRPDPPLDSQDHSRQLLVQRRKGFARAYRRQLPQGDRLPVEGRPGRAEGVRQEVQA